MGEQYVGAAVEQHIHVCVRSKFQCAFLPAALVVNSTVGLRVALYPLVITSIVAW